jgi:hypothetical protein
MESNMSQLSDHEQLRVRQERLEAACQVVAALSRKVGQAKQVIEFSPEYRKRALAKAMSPYLDDGESATAADAKGRASFNYGEELKELAQFLNDAETVKAQWEAAKVEWESCRSLLSLEKELVGL